MESERTAYRRQGNSGCLQLGSASRDCADLLSAARLANADEQAAAVTVDLSRAEELDLASVQILLALRAELRAAGRTFAATGLSPGLTDLLRKIDLGLE